MTRKIFYNINPNLKGLGGHYYEYVSSLSESAKQYGYDHIVLANKQAEISTVNGVEIKKVFPHEIWHVAPFARERIHKTSLKWRNNYTLFENMRYYRILKTTLDRRNLKHDWIVFSDMVCHNQLLAWSWWFRGMAKHNPPRLVLLFRYSADWFDYWSNHETSAQAFKILEQSDPGDRILICTDSDRLAEDHARFTDLPIKVLPIPHTTHPILQNGIAAKPQNPHSLCFLSLGGARDEKGILEIIEAIKILNNSQYLGQFRFILQLSGASDEIMSAVKELESLDLTNVELVFQTLSTDDYYTLLQSADVVLAPYWHSIYKSRTSGIFTEALAAGKPVIVTEDTWMSDQLDQYGAGVLCSDRDPYDLSQAILSMEASYEKYVYKAQVDRVRWVEKHNPDAFFKELIS